MRISEQKLRRMIRSILIEAQTFDISSDVWNFTRSGKSFDEDKKARLKNVENAVSVLLKNKELLKFIYPNEASSLIKSLNMLNSNKESTRSSISHSKFVEPDDERTQSLSADMFKGM